MQSNQVQFSVVSHAAWAPNLTTYQAWCAWAKAPFVITGDDEPAVAAMPSMLRRRAGFLGKMALEVAYQCMDGRKNIPAVFCSRHGDVGRATELVSSLAQHEPLSPTQFGLAVHNASAGLFSIARHDLASHIAIAAGQSTIEHALIEACGLLADGAPAVLVVAYDNCLPAFYQAYLDCQEQPHAWAWLIEPAREANRIRLNWSPAESAGADRYDSMPRSLAVWKFYVSDEQVYENNTPQRQWRWSKHG